MTLPACTPAELAHLTGCEDARAWTAAAVHEAAERQRPMHEAAHAALAWRLKRMARGPDADGLSALDKEAAVNAYLHDGAVHEEDKAVLRELMVWERGFRGGGMACHDVSPRLQARGFTASKLGVWLSPHLPYRLAVWDMPGAVCAEFRTRHATAQWKRDHATLQQHLQLVLRSLALHDEMRGDTQCTSEAGDGPLARAHARMREMQAEQGDRRAAFRNAVEDAHRALAGSRTFAGVTAAAQAQVDALRALDDKVRELQLEHYNDIAARLREFRASPNIEAAAAEAQQVLGWLEEHRDMFDDEMRRNEGHLASLRHIVNVTQAAAQRVAERRALLHGAVARIARRAARGVKALGLRMLAMAAAPRRRAAPWLRLVRGLQGQKREAAANRRRTAAALPRRAAARLQWLAFETFKAEYTFRACNIAWFARALLVHATQASFPGMPGIDYDHLGPACRVSVLQCLAFHMQQQLVMQAQEMMPDAGLEHVQACVQRFLCEWCERYWVNPQGGVDARVPVTHVLYTLRLFCACTQAPPPAETARPWRCLRALILQSAPATPHEVPGA